MWQAGHLCYLFHLQMLGQILAATFQNNCIDRGRNDIQFSKCCLLHPPPSPTPLRTRREFTSRFCHHEFLGVHIACWVVVTLQSLHQPHPNPESLDQRKAPHSSTIAKAAIKTRGNSQLTFFSQNTFFILEFIC